MSPALTTFYEFLDRPLYGASRLVLAALVTAWASVPARAEILEQVLLKVNGEIFTKSDLETRQAQALRQLGPGFDLKTANDDQIREALDRVTPQVMVSVAVICQPKDKVPAADRKFGSISPFSPAPGWAIRYQATYIQLWNRHSTTVRYRVYSLIFFRPTSPSFCNFSSGGHTLASSCRMIEAEIYGMIPSPNTVALPKSEAENSCTS